MSSKYTWMWILRKFLAWAVYACGAPFKIGLWGMIALGRFIDPDPPEGA